MGTLTVRLSADTHTRLKDIAQQRHMNVNKLMEELSVIAITQHDAEARFRALVARGAVQKGLDVLDTLDGAFGTTEGRLRVK